MAEVVGFLREDAQYGEKQTLNYLSRNLPKEYTVYVETPLRKDREIRYPDFIILTNYGVIVLEVKDWVIITKANPHGCTVRSRKGEDRFEHNPVHQAREYALILNEELNKKRKESSITEKIPWGCAAVLFNQPTAVITQLRRPWGEESVLGKADLEVSDLLLNRLKMLFPVDRMRSLTRSDLDMIRATIYPVVEIEVEGRPTVILDTQQEKLVAEPIKQETPVSSRKAQELESKKQQGSLFEDQQSQEEVSLPVVGERISKNVSIRLVRGFSGSGKTLVMIQRAKFLEAQFPEWEIGVFTFNKELQKLLESEFRGSNIKPRTFHSFCKQLIEKDSEPYELENWLEEYQFDYPVIRDLGIPTITSEFEWLQDMGLLDLEDYLSIERHGIGETLRLKSEQRQKIFEAFASYRSFLAEENRWEWHELPLMILDGIEKGEIIPPLFDLVLIDEAQDWAPTWFHIISKIIKPDHGSIFLADDPSQSIYRNFSWKEKGVEVVGRTRWLRIPYRNTYEIYQAAYALIANHQGIQASLSDSGELVSPDLSSQEMRHGKRPLVQRLNNVTDELAFIKERITALRRDGIRDDKMAVLTRNRSDLNPVAKALDGCKVNINTFHSFKGLEFEVVFIPHLHKTFYKEGDEFEASERRLLYMAMSRARSELYMTYSGRLSRIYNTLRQQSLADFIE
jgi:hypothetical protein